jgi:hypothetical protein
VCPDAKWFEEFREFHEMKARMMTMMMKRLRDDCVEGVVVESKEYDDFEGVRRNSTFRKWKKCSVLEQEGFKFAKNKSTTMKLGSGQQAFSTRAILMLLFVLTFAFSMSSASAKILDHQEGKKSIYVNLCYIHVPHVTVIFLWVSQSHSELIFCETDIF